MAKTRIRPWKQLSSRTAYQNSWISVHEDQVQLPTGHKIIYGVVTPASDFIGVVPFLDSGTVLLVRQYRYTQDDVTWEIPSGGIGVQETPEQAVQRELSEEIGYRANHIQLMSLMRSNKSIMRDLGYIFIAKDLIEAPTQPDATEELERVPVSLNKALEMIARHEITDCVSIIGLLLAKESLSAE